MIHVALDTNIFTDKPSLSSAPFKLLKYLCASNYVKLHVPYLVEKEFASQIEANQKKKVKEVIEGLSYICGYDGQGEDTLQVRELLINHLKPNKETFVKERLASFENWLVSTQANRINIAQNEAQHAFEAYFKGSPPFKNVKDRQDIPDAFIFRNLLRVNEGVELHFVSNDKTLRKACENAGMICYDKLSDFTDSEIVQSLIPQIKAHLLNKVSSKIGKSLSSNLELLTSVVEDNLYDIGNIVLGELHHKDDLTDAREVYVSGVYKPESVLLESKLEYYGDSLFTAKFTAEVELQYEFPIDNSEAYEYSNDRYHLEYLNKHYMNAETTDLFMIKGNLAIQLDTDIERLKSLKDFSEFEVSSDAVITVDDFNLFEIIENDD